MQVLLVPLLMPLSIIDNLPYHSAIFEVALKNLMVLKFIYTHATFCN